MENQWLTWAKRLDAIASTGLHYCKDQFDRERYEEVAALARSMMASLGNISIDAIENLMPVHAKGYVTPKVDVRAAVIEDGEILLVREKSDGLWTLPGGFAEVGLAPSENVIKEVREEAGIRVTVTGLYSIRHKAKHAYNPDIRDFYKMYFLCQQVGEEAVTPGAEVMDAAFFAPDHLPALSRGRVIESDISGAFAFHDSPAPMAVID
jgi:ADP-ribose pyrophosphatase YjhB (NUDIX family)